MSRLNDPAGVAPVRLHAGCARIPERGEAQGRNGLAGESPTAKSAPSLEMRTADGSEAQKPIQTHAIRRRNFCSHVSLLKKRRVKPDENQSGRDVWTNRHVGPARSEMIRHLCAGANLRRARRTPGAPPGEIEGRTDRPARPR